MRFGLGVDDSVRGLMGKKCGARNRKAKRMQQGEQEETVKKS